MLKDKSALKNALQEMFYSKDCGNILHIIDDYNIDYKTSDKTIDGFVEAIDSIDNIKEIRFYVQTDSFTLGLENNVLNEKEKKLFACALSIFMKRKKLIKNFYSCEKVLKRIQRFANQFKDKKVVFVVYESIRITPPFHGRYWLSEKKGLIVDGSISTTENKLVLAQMMDEENFGIIKETFNKALNSREIFDSNEGLIYLREYYERLKNLDFN